MRHEEHKEQEIVDDAIAPSWRLVRWRYEGAPLIAQKSTVTKPSHLISTLEVEIDSDGDLDVGSQCYIPGKVLHALIADAATRRIAGWGVVEPNQAMAAELRLAEQRLTTAEEAAAIYVDERNKARRERNALRRAAQAQEARIEALEAALNETLVGLTSALDALDEGEEQTEEWVSDGRASVERCTAVVRSKT